jgi:hypothetical protein
MSLKLSREGERSRLPRRAKTCVLLVALLILTVSSWDAIRQDSGDQNLYVHQAQAFLHRRLDINVALHDTAMRDGKYYVVFPPFPALLLLPFVALLGVVETKTVLISVLISVLNVALLMRILERLEVNPRHVPWAVAAFFLGTAYWSSVRVSFGVWFFAHIVAVGCTFLAIDQALGRGSGALTGLFLGMAFLTRQLSVYHAIFLAAALWYNPRCTNGKSRLANLAGFAGALCLCVGVYLVFNWLRFGSVLDTGYAYLPLEDHLKERVERFGLFDIAYVPFNFAYMFLQGFHLEFDPPTLLTVADVDPFGTAITFASPFIFTALWARQIVFGKPHRRVTGGAGSDPAPALQADAKNLLRTAWASVCLTLIHLLLYYNNGSRQWNAQRFSLDFLPVLIILVAVGVTPQNEKLWKATIVYSIFLNVLTLMLMAL